MDFSFVAFGKLELNTPEILAIHTGSGKSLVRSMGDEATKRKLSGRELRSSSMFNYDTAPTVSCIGIRPARFTALSSFAFVSSSLLSEVCPRSSVQLCHTAPYCLGVIISSRLLQLGGGSEMWLWSGLESLTHQTQKLRGARDGEGRGFLYFSLNKNR